MVQREARTLEASFMAGAKLRWKATKPDLESTNFFSVRLGTIGTKERHSHVSSIHRALSRSN